MHILQIDFFQIDLEISDDIGKNYLKKYQLHIDRHYALSKYISNKNELNLKKKKQNKLILVSLFSKLVITVL